jgi:hypothetical protein
MEQSLLNLLKPYEDISIAFQRYLLQVTNGHGNFVEFATTLSWRMQLGMVLEFLDVVYDVTISIFPRGGAIIKTINERQYIVDVFTTIEPMHPLSRYYRTIDNAFKYILKPF